MAEYSSGAYIVERGGRRSGGPGRPNRAAGVIIIVLLLLTAGICLLIVFLPRYITHGVSGTPSFAGKTFYLLELGKETERFTARERAQYAIERGGAGYIYNDGNYRIITSVYDREADAKTLASVNADCDYFALSFPQVAAESGDKAVLDYVCGEMFTLCATAITELDRGNITEASAEHAVRSALDEACRLSYSAGSERIKNAVLAAARFDIPQGRSVLSYLRYLQVRAVVSVLEAVL